MKNTQGGAARVLPEDIKPLAEQAKQAFEREKYGDAEKLYQKALQIAPKNLYLLSNTAVVQFRMGKLKQAEETFRKALAIAPRITSAGAPWASCNTARTSTTKR